MRAVLRKTLADIRRRRLQSAVIALVVLLAGGTATLALTLLFSSTDSYNRAFAEQRGAHVLQEFDGNRVTAGRLRATAHLPAVAAAAGPWATNDVTFEPTRMPPDVARMAAEIGPPKLYLEVVGRTAPGGPADDLRLVSGRWLRAARDIVLTRSFARTQGVELGDVIVGIVRNHRVRLRVVGEVIDVDEMDAANQNPQHAWVLPRTLPALVAPGNQPGYEMAYRFHRAAPNADLRAALAQIRAALPTGAMAFTRSYIDVRNNYTLTDALILTFLLAFSAFALGAAALVIANIVTGAVLAGLREIGVMRAVGYSPAQVVQTLVGQMLVPSAAGCLLGIPPGVLLARPLIGQSADAMGLPAPPSFSIEAVLLVLAGVLAVVCVSAAVPAWRAGTLSPVRAIVSGTGPEGGNGEATGWRAA